MILRLLKLSKVVEREVFRTSDGNERESKRNRSARRQIEKELRQREAEEAAQAAALGYDPRQTRGGFRGGPFRGMPTTSFGGRGGRGPVLGAGGRLGGFGPGPLSMGLGSEPSEPDEENEPTTTLEPTTLTKAEPTTEPSRKGFKYHIICLLKNIPMQLSIFFDTTKL